MNELILCVMSTIKLEWKEFLLYRYLEIMLLLLMQTFRYSKRLNGEKNLTWRRIDEIQEKEQEAIFQILYLFSS